MRLNTEETKLAAKAVGVALANEGRFPIHTRGKMRDLLKKLRENKEEVPESGPVTEDEMKKRLAEIEAEGKVSAADTPDAEVAGASEKDSDDEAVKQAIAEAQAASEAADAADAKAKAADEAVDAAVEAAKAKAKDENPSGGSQAI